MNPALSLISLIFPALLSACAQAASVGDRVPEPPPAPRAVAAATVDSRAVDVGPGELDGVVLLGTHVLTMEHPAFGGFSAIEVADGRIYAVTDNGWWMEGAIVERPGGIVPMKVLFTPLRDRDGATYDKSGGDAEGLALTLGSDQPAVSFELDHRIMRRASDGRMGGLITHPAFEDLRSNGGLEALAALPDGRLLVIAEDARAGRHPMFLISPDGQLLRGGLPEVASFSVTGADLGPDGKLYVLLRDYTPLIGVTIRIDRYNLTAAGWPDDTSRQQIARFASRTGIDNMEGISAWRDQKGRLRLAVISDDNFSVVQRTLLMDLLVLE